MSKKRKKYTKEFKESAVKLWQAGDKSSEFVAKELGINASMLRHWAAEYETYGERSFTGNGNKRKGSELEEEMYKLRKELAEVKEERDILKKAWAFFSETPKDSTR